MDDPGRVVVPFQLVANAVRELTVTNEFIHLSEDASDVRRMLNVEYAIDEISEQPDSMLMGLLTLYIRMSVLTEEGKGINISIVNQGCFVLPAEQGRELMEQMLSVNGTAALYSISRAIVNTVSAQCMLSGKVNLPMINTTRIPKRGKDPTDTE